MELDDAYTIASHIEGGEAYPPRWAAEAAAFRASLGERAELGLHYGSGERQVYDLFRPEGPAQGTVIFVHGGYWRAFDRTSWSHLAAGPVARGWSVAMPSYDLCPDVRISQITGQIARAIRTISERSGGALVLTGHSAGGHLVSRMLAPGMLPDAVADRIANVVPISPLADLEPLMKTSMNADFRLTVAEARAESPVHQPAPEVPVTVWVGADERPALLEQARALARAWDCALVIAPRRHHFDVIESLTEPDGDLTQRLLS